MKDLLAPIPLATVRHGQDFSVEADEALRAAIAQRLGLPAVDAFAATATLERDGDAVTAIGRIEAQVTQACAATGDPIPATVDEVFTLAFVPEPDFGEDEEFELGADDLDTLYHDGRAVPLSDALIDTLGLALDPFARSEGAEARLRDAGVLTEEEAGKFGALAALKKKMEGGD